MQNQNKPVLGQALAPQPAQKERCTRGFPFDQQSNPQHPSRYSGLDQIISEINCCATEEYLSINTEKKRTKLRGRVLAFLHSWWWWRQKCKIMIRQNRTKREKKAKRIAARLAERISHGNREHNSDGGRRRDWHRGETGREITDGVESRSRWWRQTDVKCISSLSPNIWRWVRTEWDVIGWSVPVGTCSFGRTGTHKPPPPITTHLHTQLYGAALKRAFDISRVSRHLADVGCMLHMCCKPSVAAVIS